MTEPNNLGETRMPYDHDIESIYPNVLTFNHKPEPIKKLTRKQIVLNRIWDYIEADYYEDQKLYVKIFRNSIYYMLFPLFLLLGTVWWREHSMFIISNLRMLIVGKGL